MNLELPDEQFALIYGSYQEDPTTAGDLDIIFVGDRQGSRELTSKLSARVDLPIDGRWFPTSEFEERLRCRDYMLASVLSESPKVLGDEQTLHSLRQRPPLEDARCVSYNLKLARSSYQMAREQRELHRPSDYHRLDDRNERPLLRAVSYLGYAVGYLEQAQRIEEGQPPATFARLMEEGVLNRLYRLREELKEGAAEEEVDRLFSIQSQRFQEGVENLS